MTLYTTAQEAQPTLAELEAQRADIDAKIAAASRIRRLVCGIGHQGHEA